MTHLNSIDAYRNADKETRRQLTAEILEYIRLSNGISRQELAKELSVEINSICGLVYNLIKQGKVITNGHRISPTTRQKNSILYPAQ